MNKKTTYRATVYTKKIGLIRVDITTSNLRWFLRYAKHCIEYEKPIVFDHDVISPEVVVEAISIDSVYKETPEIATRECE